MMGVYFGGQVIGARARVNYPSLRGGLAKAAICQLCTVQFGPRSRTMNCDSRLRSTGDACIPARKMRERGKKGTNQQKSSQQCLTSWVYLNNGKHSHNYMARIVSRKRYMNNNCVKVGTRREAYHQIVLHSTGPISGTQSSCLASTRKSKQGCQGVCTNIPSPKPFFPLLCVLFPVTNTHRTNSTAVVVGCYVIYDKHIREYLIPGPRFRPAWHPIRAM